MGQSDPGVCMSTIEEKYWCILLAEGNKMHSIRRKNVDILMLLRWLMKRIVVVMVVAIVILWINLNILSKNMCRRRYSFLDRIPSQVNHMRDLVEVSDEDCKNMLRMDRVAFLRLSNLLHSSVYLKNSKYVTIQEKLAMFFSILSHHTKNRYVTFHFRRTGQTVSKYFQSSILNRSPMIVLIPDGGKFKGSLRALDGTYIDVQVPKSEKARYMNRKGQVTVNVLTRWEGSTTDSRVLRNVINCTHGLKIPKGFLTPYKGVGYHLSEWSSRRPQNDQEYFNMKHTRVRNVIERTFGLPKIHWGILRSLSWYPVKIHNQIIMACSLIHNYIHTHMKVDPLENGLDEFMNNKQSQAVLDNPEVIDSLDASPE
ncbi:hypothetical protein ACS0TY_013681 [Phlomoides rotata]